MSRRSRRSLLWVLIQIYSSATVLAQEGPWAPLQFLVGSWNGEETGAAGIGKGDRVYEFIFGGPFLHARNTSRFPPQEKNPEGEVHEDWSFFSHDRTRDRIVLREFYIEGFVIQLSSSLRKKMKTASSSFPRVSKTFQPAAGPG